jgi:hypothetical protein
VTTNTVGAHLGHSHIYRKLDLEGSRARELLGERLISPQPSAAVPDESAVKTPIPP